MTQRIDAHHHLWSYTAADYGWITEPMSVLRHDFQPADLRPRLDAAGLTGSVAVQARQSLAETEWLLEQADGNDWIRGVVGWAPIAAADFPETLARLCRAAKLKGLRHVVQDERDDFLLGAAFNEGIRRLRNTGMVYDILIYERQLGSALRFVDLHPDQAFVLDHCAKPSIADGSMASWAAGMREMARRTNVCCKLSGLVTEAGWADWTPATLEPYWRVALDAFGPSRLMFGSDWPVALLATTYQRWVDTVAAWTAPLSADERSAIWGGTAARVYSL